MKQEIHPKYGNTSIRCACGNVIETRSTIEGTIQVEICSACHPFFTGKQKLMDTAGRIDRFRKKFGTRLALGSQKKVKRPKPEPLSVKVIKPSPAKKTGLEKLKEIQSKKAPTKP